MHAAEQRCSRGCPADVDGGAHGLQPDPRVGMLQHSDDCRERGGVPDFPQRIEGVPHREPALVIEPRQQRRDRRHSHPGQHFAHPNPDPAVWLLREERREHLHSLRAGQTQIFGRDVHRARRRVLTEEIHDERDVAVPGDLASEQRGRGRRVLRRLGRGVGRDTAQDAEGQIGLAAGQRLAGDLRQRIECELRAFGAMSAGDQRQEHVRASREEHLGAAGVHDLLPQFE